MSPSVRLLLCRREPLLAWPGAGTNARSASLCRRNRRASLCPHSALFPRSAPRPGGSVPGHRSGAGGRADSGVCGAAATGRLPRALLWPCPADPGAARALPAVPSAPCTAPLSMKPRYRGGRAAPTDWPRLAGGASPPFPQVTFAHGFPLEMGSSAFEQRWLVYLPGPPRDALHAP